MRLIDGYIETASDECACRSHRLLEESHVLTEFPDACITFQVQVDTDLDGCKTMDIQNLS